MKLRKNPLKNEEGFTLIEIIAVLVIMGILAAVAIPKFFDLQSKARDKAIYTAVSELKVRVNQAFAKQLLDGVAVSAIQYGADYVGTDIGEDFNVTSWNPGTTSDDSIQVTIEYIPDLDNPGENVVTKTESIPKPRTG
ncbi:MAG: type II secretion system protein [Desulfobacterales bacterium]|nr:type II secretion system protein [Desulfobacterales bacterium]